MRCPYCGEEMIKGVVQSRDGVCWTEKERPVAAVGIGGGMRIPLAEPSARPFRGSSAEAFCCTKCKKIVIDFSERE
ncbi:MAG: hypothetical protein J5586_07540 [Clostridia bacterium]|nr:hypothetical protein [Clostridia bacterium]